MAGAFTSSYLFRKHGHNGVKAFIRGFHKSETFCSSVELYIPAYTKGIDLLLAGPDDGCGVTN